MKKEILVSVIVPVYNMEKFLGRCLDSILGQSFANTEIILVDDGSKDGSLNICRTYEDGYPNIRVIAKENGGVSTARNAGMETASGDWIMFVDPDDYLEPACIEELIKGIGSRVDIVAGTCYAREGDKCIQCHFFGEDRQFVTPEEKKDLFLQLMDMGHGQAGPVMTAIGVPWGKLYRKSMLDHYGLRFDASLRRVQDNLFNMYAFYCARKIVYLDRPLYDYSYEHIGGFFNRYRPDYVDIYLPVMDARYKALTKLGLIRDPDLRKCYVNEAMVNMGSICKSGIFNPGDGRSYKEKKKHLKEVLSHRFTKTVLHIRSLPLIDTPKYRLFWFMLKFRTDALIAMYSRM